MYAPRKLLVFSVIAVGLLITFIVIGYSFYITTKSSVDQIPSASFGPRSADSLKLVAMLTRHGNRAPRYIIYNDTSQWPYGLEELTNVGRLQMFNLGARLRSMYNGFLKEEYSAGDLYVTSTLKNRTLQSALCLLAGLYPPRGFQVWNKDISWQPIPVFTDSPDNEVKILNTCPRYAQYSKLSLQNVTSQYAENISNLVEKISPYISNDKNLPEENWTYAGSMMLCEDIEGVPLPTWSKEVYPHPILDMYYQELVARFIQTEIMTRLRMGPFWDNLLDIFSRKVKGTLTPDRQFYYFSGHDISIMALKALLDIPMEERGLVYPASAVVFELHQDQTTGVFSVQVLYIDGKSQGEPKVLRVGGCDTSCEFNQLVNLTKRFSGVDFDTECQVD